MPASALSTAIDVHRFLAEDADNDTGERVQRDRLIGKPMTMVGDRERVLAWWNEVRTHTSSLTTGERVVQVRRWLYVLAALLGLLVGAGASVASLTFDGAAPINVWTLLLVLLGLPTLLLVLSLVAMAARALRFSGLTDLLTAINLGRWLTAAMTRFGGGQNLLSVDAGRVAFWQLNAYAQTMAIGFFVGVVALFLLQLTFTDLAFGWSSTIGLSDAGVHQLLTRLSIPWQHMFPEAVPTLELVQESRFYRLDGPADVSVVARLGDWWVFVMACLLFWGLLPRCLLQGFISWRLRVAERALLCAHPAVTELLDRLQAPVLDIQSDGPEDELPSPGIAESEIVLGAAEAAWFGWNDVFDHVDIASGLQAYGCDPATTIELSSSMSDSALREAVSGVSERRFHVVTKGWEPPLLEFIDVLTLMRAELGQEGVIVVIPLEPSGVMDLGNRAIWAEVIGRQGDVRTYVAQSGAQSAAGSEERTQPEGDA